MKGLTSKEVNERIEHGRVNADVNIKTKSIKQIIAGHTFTLFNFVNVFLAVCVALVNSYKNMMFIGVAFWNLIIGIIQEVRAKKVIDKLSLLSHSKAHVIRDNEEKTIELDELVVDDIFILQSGNQVPVDAVVCEGECQVNESLLTGESEPVLRKYGDEVLSGSFLVSGKIIAKVKNVGAENYVNKITGQAKYIKKPNSQMMDAINTIIKIVSICLVPLGTILFLRQRFGLDQSIKVSVVSTVAGIIGMIPSGLVLLTSIVLAVSVIRLARYNTLVQEMFCIETLARVDVLCLDKTGTITEGRMQVENIEYLDEDISQEQFADLMCNFCNYVGDSNPTFVAVNSAFKNKASTKMCAKKTIPFSSERKYSGVIFDNDDEIVMGAAEFVLGDRYSYDIKKKVDEYSALGKRVVVVCKNNILVALIVIGDIIRAEAKETLEYFEAQGVTLKIISGDNPITVSKVAKQAGLKEADKWINATDLKSVEDIKDAVKKYTVFGRVTPKQKYEIIKSLREQGHVVGMTGDGANDVMALKEADCSVAMQSGSDAARNASQLVLLDSNFSSMPRIVAEGRRSINNIERSAVLYLSKTIYAFLFAVIFICIHAAYPFQPIQFTLIGALSIGIPSFILALEPNTDIVEGSFLGNILKKAIPGGLLVVVNVVIGIIISKIWNLNAGQTSTLCTILLVDAAMIILLDVCRPWNIIRAILFIFMSLGFIGAFNVMEGLFGISKLKIELYMLIAICAGVTYVIHTGITILVNHIFKRKLSNDL